MILTGTLLVTPRNGPRPAGRPDRCFYCGEPVGRQHEPECACRLKLVVYEVEHPIGTFEWYCTVPESWDEDFIEFHKNECTWCADNVVESESFRRMPPPFSVDTAGEGRCLCGTLTFRFLRDATPEEADRIGVLSWAEYNGTDARRAPESIVGQMEANKHERSATRSGV
jgi:hypothetical protein